jgi:Fe-S-cluster containining protein
LDEPAYFEKQDKEFREYEARCKRCGACCGVKDNDPCLNLRKDNSGKYYCDVYENRIGMHKTVSGKEFACVPIRDLSPNLPFKGCAYYE